MAAGLPAPRPVLWPLRPVASAEVGATASDGRVVVTIEHAPLRGVTPEMLAWWYAHVLEYAGSVFPRYLVWHPLDHISYEVVDGGGDVVGPGTRFHIVEAPGRDPGKLLDLRVTVEEINEERAVIARRVLGTAVVRLENEFATGRGGARYLTRMFLGQDTLLGRLLLNRVATTRALPPAKRHSWIGHHVEEIGNLENFLPAFYRQEQR